MRRGRILVQILALASGVAVLGARQTPQYRTGTHTVPIHATVLDAEGRVVPDLAREDFLVLDNGLPQPLTMFVNDEQPITIVMMLDRSGSVMDRFKLVEAAAAEFVRRLTPQDRARIGSFSERVQIDPATFTSDRDTLLQILKTELQDIGPTPLWNATSAAMTALSGQAGRRVVLVFTDGRDAPLSGRPNVTFAEVQRRAELEEVMVYGIGLWGECAPAPETAGATGAPPPDAWLDLQRSGRPDQDGQGGRRGRPVGRGRIRLPGGLPVPLPLPIPGRGAPPRPPTVFEPRRGSDEGCGASRPDPGLRALADVGGGGYFELRETDDLAATFARIADELHRQYLLAFVAPAHDGALHRLDVRVGRAGLTVRARRSYVAPR